MTISVNGTLILDTKVIKVQVARAKVIHAKYNQFLKGIVIDQLAVFKTPVPRNLGSCKDTNETEISAKEGIVLQIFIKGIAFFKFCIHYFFRYVKHCNFKAHANFSTFL